ncbi:unnamed protein product [Microthlaspi erraticum]|uniref:Uncharacterized protein n=1 Tax=Microthlaspi erraticum TaxID=1685480 RepID=A0A6D2JWI2_9BRAS|nr:unnamed protein product [Microthlaspi erraticum]
MWNEQGWRIRGQGLSNFFLFECAGKRKTVSVDVCKVEQRKRELHGVVLCLRGVVTGVEVECGVSAPPPVWRAGLCPRRGWWRDLSDLDRFSQIWSFLLLVSHRGQRRFCLRRCAVVVPRIRVALGVSLGGVWLGRRPLTAELLVEDPL